MSRFGLTAESVRLTAEKAAYCMAAEVGLGLSPSRTTLIKVMQKYGFTTSRSIELSLDALEYLRLARAVEGEAGAIRGFTFAYRPFQEYFATCLVLRESSRVDSRRLLTDGRWRETAVTMFQTQDAGATQALLGSAEELLANMISDTEQTFDAAADDSTEEATELKEGMLFDWPPGSLHLLSLLQDGLPAGDKRRSSAVEVLAGHLLRSATLHGQLHDRRWAVEVCLAADPKSSQEILRTAFRSGSGWLREAAYAQAARLEKVPDDLRADAQRACWTRCWGRLRQQRVAIEAELRRRTDWRPERLLERVFLFTPPIDGALWLVLATLCLSLSDGSGFAVVVVAMLALLGHGSLYVDRGARSIAAEARP